MAIINKGKTFSNGEQLTADKLNQVIDNATFTTSAVDNLSTQIAGSAIIVRDGGITPAKLSAGAPDWTGGQTLTIKGDGNSGGLEINYNVVGHGDAFIDFHSTDVAFPDYDARIINNDTGELDLINTRDGDVRIYGSDSLAPRAAISDAGIRYNKAGGNNTFAFKWDGDITSGYQVIARIDNAADVPLVSTYTSNKIKVGWNASNVVVNIDNARDVVLVEKATFDALEARVAALENP